MHKNLRLGKKKIKPLSLLQIFSNLCSMWKPNEVLAKFSIIYLGHGVARKLNS